jgi:hypothetical protein
LGWLSLNLVAFAAFLSLGVEVPIFAIFAVYSVIMVFQNMPLILPGGIGIVEILMTSLHRRRRLPGRRGRRHNLREKSHSSGSIPFWGGFAQHTFWGRGQEWNESGRFWSSYNGTLKIAVII